MTTTATAGWRFPALIDALARAGWGDLDTGAAQGIRSVLRALAILLPHGSATGAVTVAQIADAAGLSVRWTGHCMRVLEAMNLIAWTRGQIIAGRPTPGHVRVNKRALADMVTHARRTMTDRVRARATETGRRIRETLRNSTQLNRPRPPQPQPAPARQDQRKPLSPHKELGSTLPPYGEETTSLLPVKWTKPASQGRRKAALRAAQAAAAAS